MTPTAQQAIRDIIWKHCVGDAEKAANEIATYLTRLDKKVQTDWKPETKLFMEAFGDNPKDFPYKQPDAPTAGDGELIATYAEYVKLLGDEISDLVGLHIAHGGWNSPRTEKGKELRDRICRLTNTDVSSLPAPQNAAGDNWISVDKDVPEYYQHVLVWSEGKIVVTAWRANDGEHDIWTMGDSDLILEPTHWQPLPVPPTATANLLPNLEKSTANLSQIKDKDQWLRELRGHDTASQQPTDSGIERWPSVNTSTSEAMMNSQMSKSKEFHEVVGKHLQGELGNIEVNLLRNLIKANRAYVQQLKQTVKELTEQLKQQK